jgi:uncharacterized membrane protein
MSHHTRRTIDPDAIRTLYYLAAVILGALGVVVLSAVLVLGEATFPETALAVFSGVALGVVPWFAANAGVIR